MRYATVCSGIEAPSVAWEPLGWKPVWFSEIEPFPCAVLKHHYPQVPNLGDMKKIHEDERYQASRRAIDVICGGTPCQSFSVAGLRRGMADPRGNLALHYLRIVDEIRPRWVVWENVPGVLSSSGGRDFGAFLGALGQLGYGWAYRILDAQHFGVPQRRRRVFVVGHLGGWQCAAAALFERESLRRDTTPGRSSGQAVAALTASGVGTSGADDNQAQAGHIIAPCLNGNGRAAGSVTQQDAENGALVTGALCARDFMSVSDQQAGSGKIIACIKGAAIGRMPENGPQYGEVLDDGSCYTLNCTEQHAVYFESRYVRNGRGAPSEITPPLKAENGKTGKGDGAPLVFQAKASASDFVQVRRLTPVECERLQGFPDGYTDIPGYSSSGRVPDGPRYRALGNSMAVPVMRWIGRRIEMVEKIINAGHGPDK